MVQYTKDEYIKLMDEKNTELESQLTETAQSWRSNNTQEG